MSPTARGTVVSILLRSFSVQASWNYRTLIGHGFAYVMLPVLRSVYAGRPTEFEEAVRRHTAVFNSHPYFAPMAVGAVAVLEATENLEVVDRFKSAVRGSLGSLGDRLIWTGFRPLCVLLTLVALMLGAGWAAATIGFLLVYNAGHVATRIWALRFGLEHGRKLGEQLRGVPVERIQRLLQSSAAFALGIASVLVLGGRSIGVPPQLWSIVAGVIAAILGIRFAGRTRMPLVLLLTLVTLAGIALGVMH